MLAYAAEEAEQLSHRHIGSEHLLLGLLREEKCFAAQILMERGLQLAQIQEEVRRNEDGAQQELPPTPRDLGGGLGGCQLNKTAAWIAIHLVMTNFCVVSARVDFDDLPESVSD